MDKDCAMDALLGEVVTLARKRRQDIRSVYKDPEEAWLDGFLAGWFDGHFSTPSEPATSSIPEEGHREVLS